MDSSSMGGVNGAAGSVGTRGELRERPRYSLRPFPPEVHYETALMDHDRADSSGEPAIVASFFVRAHAEECLAALEQHPVLCRLVRQLADAVSQSANAIHHGDLAGTDNPSPGAIAEYRRLCDLVGQADEVLQRTRTPTAAEQRHRAMIERLSAGKVAKRPEDMRHSRPTGHNEFEVATSPATVPAAEDAIDSRDTPLSPPRRDSAEAAVAIVGQGPYANVMTPSSLGHPAAPVHEPHAIDAGGGAPAGDRHEDDGN